MPMPNAIQCPRLTISALRGGAGKSTIAIGLTAALRETGDRVAPFKKGPDYIDAGWLSMAAGVPCHNLDTFLTTPPVLLGSFYRYTLDKDIAVIEGNRGLYDGIDLDGATSTAEIAKLLRSPVVLCLDVTKTTRTCAAVVKGCIDFDSVLTISGIILNRVAGARHESILRRSIEHYCGLPVIGAIPKQPHVDLPERHMGLVPTPEHAWALEAIQANAELARNHIDLKAVRRIAAGAPPVSRTREETGIKTPSVPEKRPLIAVARDSAFQFYYPDNLAALEEAGAKLVFISPLTDAGLSDEIDGLYLGGGFPETHARQLANNRTFREQLSALVEDGLPVYAECGGLIYLGQSLIIKEQAYPMCDILPASFGISEKPVGHGYTISRVDAANPYFETGTELKGHEFRYSRVISWRGDDDAMVLTTLRGKGFANHRDGLCHKNVLASYTHLHALGSPGWAPALVNKAAAFAAQKKQGDR
ncbi:MAG: cobyrinate a,c-diamide synthase [Desulfosudaceae bacterium]